MRPLATVFVSLLLATGIPAFAQDHAHHHEASAPLTQEQLEQVYQQITGREVPRPVVLPAVETDEAKLAANANKAFTITARQFDYTVSPLPFTVNVGDVVTLTITVPGNDGSSLGHGIFLPPFVNSVNVARGQTVTRTFTVTGPADDYPFVCPQSGCGLGHSSMAGNMRVNAAVPNPAPTITSVSPSTIGTGGGTTVSIFGTNFVSGATVKFDTLSATSVSFVSGTQLSAIAPAHPAGAVAVTVTNPDGQSAASTITYQNPGPSIASISPAGGPNSGGTPITIFGNGFLAGATVTIGGITVAGAHLVDSSTITATTPAGPVNGQLGIAQDVVVRNPDGTTATLAGAFTWTLAPLSITGISPNKGAAGTSVVLSGTGFTTGVATSVRVGGVAATNVAVLSAVAIVFTAPAHALGAADVVVTVGTNSVTSLGGFTYAPVPPRRRAAGKS